MNENEAVQRRPRWFRLFGLALFCAVFGLAGAVGGLYLMNGGLRGPQGPPGPAGAQGVAGDTGPTADLGGLQTAFKIMDDRVSRLEADSIQRSARPPCEFVSQVVTDVSDAFGRLDVTKTPVVVCLSQP